MGSMDPFIATFVNQPLKRWTILIDGVFAKSAWEIIIRGSNIFAIGQSSVTFFFLFWHDRWPHKSVKSTDWVVFWHSIPKFTWWKLWTTRNNWIVNEQVMTPQSVVVKVKKLIVESIGCVNSPLPSTISS